MRKLQEMKTETRPKGKKKIKSPTNSPEIVTMYEIIRKPKKTKTTSHSTGPLEGSRVPESI